MVDGLVNSKNVRNFAPAYLGEIHQKLNAYCGWRIKSPAATIGVIS